MASGGARSRSGPPPDPNALRRDRPSDAAGWITLPGPRTDPAPPFPLIDQTDREAVLWESEWRRPQAHEWARLGLELEVALYVRAVGEAEKPDVKGHTLNFVRMEIENLGISVNGLARHNWRIAGAPSAPAKTPSATSAKAKTSRASSRDRLTVVPAVEDDDPAPF